LVTHFDVGENLRNSYDAKPGSVNSILFMTVTVVPVRIPGAAQFFVPRTAIRDGFALTLGPLTALSKELILVLSPLSAAPNP